MSNDFKDFIVKGEKYDLEWSHQGEGKFGDYDPNEYHDAPLIRLTLLNKDGSHVDKCSYCTNIEIDVTPEEARIISNKVFKLVELSPSPSRGMQRSSYFERDDAYSGK